MGADGSQIGIKPLPEALAIARAQDLDLVEVADKANPPVCRVMDYGKFKYEAAQKAKESRRKSSNISIKEMKYRPKIGGGDFDTKTRKVEHFLSEGHKVKVTIMFRGREVAHPELGRKILDHVANEVSNQGRIEVYPKLDGRNMVMVLAPDRKAQAAHTAKLQGEAEAAAHPETDGADAPDEAAATDVTAATETVPETPEPTTPEVEATDTVDVAEAEVEAEVPADDPTTDQD